MVTTMKPSLYYNHDDVSKQYSANTICLLLILFLLVYRIKNAAP